MKKRKHRRRGRPPVDDPRLHLPNFTVPRSLLEELERVAEAENMPQSRLLAIALHTYFKAYHFPRRLVSDLKK